MARTIQELVEKYGIDEIHRDTGIHKPVIQRYARGQTPNQFSAILIYKFSVKVGDPLDVLRPQENIWYVQLAEWLIRHNKHPYNFAKECGLSDATFQDSISGEVRNMDRLSPKTRKLIYEGTVKAGEPLEILRPVDYPIATRKEEHVPTIRHEIPTAPASTIVQLRGKINRLFEAAVDILPDLKDALYLENLQILVSQQPQDKQEMPIVAKKMAEGLHRVLEYYITVTPEERERFRRIFYGNKQTIINLAQLIDSLRSEEGVERLQSLRSIR